MNRPPPALTRLLAALKARLSPPLESESFREAALELIDAPPASSGAPTAEQTLISNIIRLRTREVGDCMIPRADICAADIESPLSEIIALMAECKHSRIPVYRDTLDDVLGMVHIKDILFHYASGKDFAIKDLLRPVLIVVPSMPAAKLLLQMRLKRQHLAIVVDEFGGVDGLVSIEDLVEEIIGEIEDEHDEPATTDIITRSDGSLLIDARVPVELFEEKCDQIILTATEREEIDTLGGYVLHLAGRVPKIGETIHSAAGFDFEILEADESRIIRLRVRGKTPPPLLNED